MIPLECRAKGGAPLRGARHDGEAGPFGTWRDEDTAPGDDLDQPERRLHMVQDS